MILLTGANGLVGSFICRKLLDNSIPFKALVREASNINSLSDVKDQIQFVKGDVLDLVSLENALAGVQTIIHCAAVVSFNPRDKKILQRINIEGTKNLVNLSLKNKVDQFIHISSVGALGKSKDHEKIDENVEWKYSGYNSVYAESKYLSELEVWRANEEGLNTTIFNPSLVLGPGDWTRSSNMVFKYVYDKKKFYIDGLVNYVDVRDVADTIFHFIENPTPGEKYIINAGQTTYQQLFELIAGNFNAMPPSIKANGLLLQLARVTEKIKSAVTGIAPKITKETIQLSMHNQLYDNSKLTNAIGIQFRKLEDTLQWACEKYLLDLKR